MAIQAVACGQGAAGPQGAKVELRSIRDEKTREAVGALMAKLSSMEGYTATVVSTGFSPHGGMVPFPDRQWVRLPDHMLIKRKSSSPYNGRIEMTQDIDIVIDGRWLLSRRTYEPLSAEQRKFYEEDAGPLIAAGNGDRKPTDAERAAAIDRNLKSMMRTSWSKIDLAAVAKEIPEYNVRTAMAGYNNLFDPFAMYRIESLKLTKETPDMWVIRAEPKTPMAGMGASQMTFDRKTGFLSKVRVDTDMMGTTVTMTTLQVDKAAPAAGLADSLFKMDVPAGGMDSIGDIDKPYVSDTESTIADYRIGREVEAESKRARQAQQSGESPQ